MFGCFWTVSALITLKNPKNFRALRAHGFFAISTNCSMVSTNYTFLSANVVFSKILVYKFSDFVYKISGFVYKFSAFVCKIFCKFKGGGKLPGSLWQRVQIQKYDVIHVKIVALIREFCSANSPKFKLQLSQARKFSK